MIKKLGATKKSSPKIEEVNFLANYFSIVNLPIIGKGFACPFRAFIIPIMTRTKIKIHPKNIMINPLKMKDVIVPTT